MREKIGFVLVLLMVVLQGFYAVYAYVDPSAFSVMRGTALVSAADSDWVKIYASRTLFVALIAGVLLYLRNYRTIALLVIVGTVMPITDAWLAYQAQAPLIVVAKHIATVLYLVLTAAVLLPSKRKRYAK